MRISDFNDFKTNAILKAAVLVASILLFDASASFAQQAGQSYCCGNHEPAAGWHDCCRSWGYFCTPLATTVTSTATCAALNPPLSAATIPLRPLRRPPGRPW